MMDSVFHNQRHARAKPFYRLFGTGFHFKGLQVILAVGLGRLPHGITALILEAIDLHADFLVEGWDKGGEGGAVFHAFQLVFTHMEGTPDVF